MKRNVLGGMLVLAAVVTVAWGGWHLVTSSSASVPPLVGGHDGVSMPMSSTPGEPVRAISLPRLDPERVSLGQSLFHDTRLSADNSISCASCHDVARGGADGLVRSRGIKGQEGAINAPGVTYASLNFRQFWDGRASSLESQVDGPVHNPVEMGSDWEQVLGKLRQDQPLLARFARAYLNGLTVENIRDALATYERSLSIPSRFDRWLEGERNILSAEEIAGYDLFKHHGCAACHQGEGVGGNMFQKFGIMDNLLDRKPLLTQADMGRFNITGRKDDRFVFKVPSLRNAGRTAPYFHDGSAKSLEEAVAVMGRAQLGMHLSSRDVTLIAAFLRSLDGGGAE